MSQQEIYQIAQRLHQQGKTPSVALIKSQLTVAMPLAAIIKGLQQWQKNPKLGESQPELISTDKPLQAFTLQQAQQQISQLQSQVDELQALVKQLSNEIAELKTPN
ncbi:hypothetical protein [Thalassotalea mangrovi]|uniref:KfrA N-terminal DNA-binding domain-containing protein n=1 Tax=Thalassotalea mangrovi TaxID=2572245 RepID=A0A4U1B2V3_9GAMM|nr:hypothetical protein [Thalassotalea mangrovi]TKB43525.1 hypothetical protein E8M12_14585 [Thalassotalea mangrovi]